MMKLYMLACRPVCFCAKLPVLFVTVRVVLEITYLVFFTYLIYYNLYTN